MGLNFAISFSGSEKKLTPAQQRRADKFDRDAAAATAREARKLERQVERQL